ncbi:hypothetical protein [Agromyces arachidis]|uniref:hypothetical protein n=1 Tax=Agromyces arachidis TaxID=766966 RepID=UPI0040567118
MNLQRLAAPVAGAGALLGVAAVAALGAGAAGLELPTATRAPVAAPASAQPAAPAPIIAAGAPAEPEPEPEPEPVAGDDVDPSLLRGGIDPAGVPVAHLEWLTIVPELDPEDPSFVTPAEREQHMIREHAIARCMADRGVTYYPAAWWLAEDSQPRGLSFDESRVFNTTLFGDQALAGYDWTRPWTERGCIGAVEHELEEAAASGTVLAVDVPDPDPATPTPRQAQFVYDQAIQRCMDDAGFDYLMPWELRPGAREYPHGPPQYLPQMPASLDEDQRAAWSRQLWGDPLPGAAYRWEDAGCSGYATHVTGRDNMH